MTMHTSQTYSFRSPAVLTVTATVNRYDHIHKHSFFNPDLDQLLNRFDHFTSIASVKSPAHVLLNRPEYPEVEGKCKL